MKGTVIVILLITASAALLLGARALRERFGVRRDHDVECDNFTFIDSRRVTDSLVKLKQHLDKRDAVKNGQR